MEILEFTGKNLEDARTKALVALGLTSDEVEIEVVEEGSAGFLGIGSRDCKIKAWKKEEKAEEPVAAPAAEVNEVKTEAVVSSSDDNSAEDIAIEFLNEVFTAMNLEVSADVKYDEAEKTLDIDLAGPEMGVIIGKRGQTLDSLQYLTNLAVNRKSDNYVKVKIDTENYRSRRKATLENLAKNTAYKVKKTRRPVVMEPMNPYERRIIHSYLQNDKYVTTHSEGEEPYRHVVVTMK